MIRCLVIAAAALGLASCGPMVSVTPPQSGGSTAPSGPPYTLPTPETVEPSTVVDKAADAVARADVAVDRAWSAYVTIRDVAELVVPFLPANRQAQVRSLEQTVENAFARARSTADLAVKAAALAEAAQTAARLEDLTVDKD